METKLLTIQDVKNIVIILIVAGFIGGFFMKMIPSEVFVGLATSIITYFYKDTQVNNLQTQVTSKDEHIKMLTSKISNV